MSLWSFSPVIKVISLFPSFSLSHTTRTEYKFKKGKSGLRLTKIIKEIKSVVISKISILHVGYGSKSHAVVAASTV